MTQEQQAEFYSRRFLPCTLSWVEEHGMVEFCIDLMHRGFHLGTILMVIEWEDLPVYGEDLHVLLCSVLIGYQSGVFTELESHKQWRDHVTQLQNRT